MRASRTASFTKTPEQMYSCEHFHIKRRSFNNRRKCMSVLILRAISAPVLLPNAESFANTPGQARTNTPANIFGYRPRGLDITCVGSKLFKPTIIYGNEISFEPQSKLCSFAPIWTPAPISRPSSFPNTHEPISSRIFPQ